MVYHMNTTMTIDELETLLGRAQASFRHDECLTCECFLGYLAQLGIDAGRPTASLTRWGSTTSTPIPVWGAIPARQPTCSPTICGTGQTTLDA
jgi:hypothetical protein